MVYTGSYPRQNGVASSMVYDPLRQTMVAALNDPSTIGNFTTETFSPAGLRFSTVSDEIAIDGAGLAAVYAISPDPSRPLSWPDMRATRVLD